MSFDDIISSPESKAHWCAYSIGRASDVRLPLSVFRRSSTVSNIFSSEATDPIEAKFYVDPQCVGGMKVPSKSLGHITKMSAMPIYGKNFKKSSSLESNSRLS